MRVRMPPLVSALESVLPDASWPVNVDGVEPRPKKALPPAESVTENGVPDWKMVMPLTAQPRSNAPLTPVSPLKKGKSYR